jgi:glycosyltransferase involved in cell wall biosynthesis
MQLSVIIPAFNREWSIRATVDSVLACGLDTEIIVVDDGSTDRTAEVACSYGSRVIVLQRANGGPAGARNTGLERATGEIIAFLDSDDIWLPGVVPDCMRILNAHREIDVLVCEATFGNETDGYRALSPVTGRGEFEKLLTHSLEPDLFKLDRDRFMRLMIERMQVFLGSTFIRRKSLDSIGPFDPGLFGGEDYELCLRLAAKHSFAFLDRPLARYKKHSGGISTNQERMSREFALAMRNIVRKPEHLTSEEHQLVRKKYAYLAYLYGYRAYDRGDLAEARRRFAAGLREGSFSLKTAAYWVASCLPGPAVRLLRRLKQRAAP